MKKTPAVLCPAVNRIEVADVAVPDLRPNEIGVRTLYSGISSGTERWTITAQYNHWDQALDEHFPFIPGYQRSGVVEEVGLAVTGFAPGDQVFSRGARLADERLMAHGYMGHIGYAVVEPDSLWKIGPTADLEEAGHWQMPGVGAHGIRLVNVQPGEVVLVLGQGLVGQVSAQLARRRGAKVITADVVPARIELSRQYSADVAVNAREVNLAEVVAEHQPAGADVVIDTTGNARAFADWVALIRREGRICLQGYYPENFNIAFHPTHEKRATVVFPCGREDPATIVPLLEQRAVQLKPLITHRFSVAQAPEAYDLVLNHPQDALGITFEWS